MESANPDVSNALSWPGHDWQGNINTEEETSGKDGLVVTCFDGTFSWRLKEFGFVVQASIFCGVAGNKNWRQQILR